MECKNQKQCWSGEFEEFLGVTMNLSEEQLKAMDGLCPMTQEIFDGCIEGCVRIGAFEQIAKLESEYPEMFREYTARQKENEDHPAVQALQSDPVWKKISGQLSSME